ncbi:hypothetical protein ACFC6U_16950 [Kitasatospora purpeofusca]|uniref:hypothetical protein n=1 Tax=Kitasatospora purpeofusca TaxID=67352 RepID=UPI0035D64182
MPSHHIATQWKTSGSPPGWRPGAAASTLCNALDDAVSSWRLRHNPAKRSVPPKPRAAVRTCWTPEEAASLLRHNAEQYADLFEVVLGTGSRRGEVLAPHWSDVHLMDRRLFVRWTLAAVNSNGLAFGRPRTEAGRAWTGLSPGEREFRGHTARQPIIASWACGSDPRLTRYGEASPGLLPMRTRGNT